LPEEALDWTPDPAKNTITVLVVHTSAALHYWVGDRIGGDSSGRVRSSEFEARGLSRTSLRQILTDALTHTRRTLADLTPDRFTEKVYSSVYNDRFSVAFSLAHALEHTALHLGHLEITRELWEQFDWGWNNAPQGS
jgi:hypothetical protein